ncbi:MAG: hypothetical protein JJLCMIEE_00576 [Acidimicrobiales bacterium]|nr:MAG: cytochrome c [Actinomycetota bacterium]MBV6507527.1 hypothetical protein [Acidimicrobiales bacterium]RIK07900.1 MAG: hypothetical protein DCC48_02815 [Acidobacteriota bacterium]
MGLGGDEEGEAPAKAEVEPATEGGAVPATPSPTAPPAVAEPEPEPDPPWVEAAKTRKKAPWWATATLVAVAVWAPVYMLTLDPPDEEQVGALDLGAETYTASCASCHGAGGGGGSGPALADGAVLETFPTAFAHVQWVLLGTANFPESTYGATAKPVGGFGTMPGFAESLTVEELMAAVRYEREELSGAEFIPEEWASVPALFAEIVGPDAEATATETLTTWSLEEVGENFTPAGLGEADQPGDPGNEVPAGG